MKKKVDYDFFTKLLMPHSIKTKDNDIYFCVKSSDLKKNKYNNNLYRLKDGRTIKLTSKGDVASYYILEDGIYFISNREEDKTEEPKTYIYRLPFDMGEAELFLTLDYNVRDIKFISKDRFYFTANYSFLYEKTLNDCKNDKKKTLELIKEEKDYQVVNEVPFYFNGAGFINGNRSHLYFYDKGKVNKLTKDIYENVDMCCLDGESLYYLSDSFKEVRNLYSKAFYLKSFDSEPMDISIPEPLMYYGIFKLPNNKIVHLGSLGTTHGLNENPKLFIYDSKGNREHVFNEDGMYSFGNSTLSDIICEAGTYGSDFLYRDNSIYFINTKGYSSEIHEFNTLTFEDKSITKVTGNVIGCTLCNDGFLISAIRDLAQEIYYSDMNGREKNLTKLNDKVMKEYAYEIPEYLGFNDEVGNSIDGWVIKPYNYNPNNKYPMVLDIHGGPKCVYSPAYFHEMQLWSSKGYFVCFCNPKGGDGKGDEFMDIFGHYGDQDYKDIMLFVDEVLKNNKEIDEKKLFVTGGSYGGYMTNWIIGHTDRFKAAASQRSISNWLSFYGTSDIGSDFVMDQIKGDPWNNIENAWNMSPLKYANLVKTPTLFIHSDEDHRCPLEQGMQMFTALRTHGVDARMCIFHGENHELSRGGKPKHRIRRLKEITEWFENHMN